MSNSIENLRRLRASAFSSNVELICRNILIGAGFFAVCFGSGDRSVLLWLAVYYCAVLCYQLYVRRLRQPFQDRQYRFALSLHMLASALFAVAISRLWQGDEALFKAAALCMIWGLSIRNLSRNPSIAALTYWDAILMGVVMAFIISTLPQELAAGHQRWLVIVLTLLIYAYYVISLFDNLRQSTRLQEAETALTERERMDIVGRITSGVAHDFNNYLTAILGQIELFRQSDSPPDRRAALDAAEAAAKRAAQLTGKLQAYAQLTVLMPSDHNIDLLIEDVVTRTATKTHPVELHISDAVAAAPIVNIDAVQTRAVILDLVLNAQEASPPNAPVSIYLDYQHLNKPSASMHGTVLARGRYLVVEISDKGSGISEQDMDHIFEPFFSTKRAPRSSGLGLAMASGFAQQFGGAIHVKSRPDRGTIVTLYLPV